MTEPTPSTWILDIVFRYKHSFGGRQPFFDALLNRKMLASYCPRCARQWCPPRLRCPEDQRATQWVELYGLGTVRYVTRGPGRDPMAESSDMRIWGLITIDGCENSVIARIVPSRERVKAGDRVIMDSDRFDCMHPIQHLVFRCVEGDS